MCALPIFARWRQTLLRSHRVPGSDPARAAARDRVRQVLIIDACTPTPDRDSGSLRMLNLMHLLIARGCAVSFLAENPAHGGRYTEAMQQPDRKRVASGKSVSVRVALGVCSIITKTTKKL